MDLVDAVLDRRPVDLVALVYDLPHAQFCDYRPFVNDNGQVFCLTCHTNVGSTNDLSDSFCPSCDCAVQSHSYDDGRCLMCGKFCRLRI